jgi:hypothetical protein
MPALKTIQFTEVLEFYVRNQPFGHWFAPETMRFFQTKLPDIAYELPGGGIYFVTSEVSPAGEKRYTVRRQLHNGDIETFGLFHGYATRAAAVAAIRAIARGV